VDRSNARASSHIRTVLFRWGLRTLGDIARLPRADVHARLGAPGARLHQAACGEDMEPLVPDDEPHVFVERMELEWPIEGLEPLSFVLARQCERLETALQQADRGAVMLAVTLRLVTRDAYERVLQLPAPMRDARVLRTLVLLDLEAHPPGAAIDVIELRADVAPGRIVQGSLLARSLPLPEDIATLTARLGALVGESRVGSPVLVDTFNQRSLAMKPFRVADKGPQPVAELRDVTPVLRRFRLPVVATVTVDRGAPVEVRPGRRGMAGGTVVRRSGPWRSSGDWWTFGHTSWDRDEWDVQLPDGTYRLARDRRTQQWDIDGVLD
jgi:protein ImuB